MSDPKGFKIGSLLFWLPILFWIQIVAAVPFAATQTLKMLQNTQGVSLAFFLCQHAFVLLNLSLAFVAFRESKEHDRKEKRQSVLIYLMWTLFTLIHIGVAFWKLPDRWKYTDNIVALVVTVGVLVTVFVGQRKRLPLTDPSVKMWLAIFFKSVPQVSLAYSIFVYGQGGLSGWWILLGHVTVLSRMAHLWISNHMTPNRSTRGSFVTELWNEGSWLITTGAWLFF